MAHDTITAKMLGLSISPSVVYITNNQKEQYTNGKISISVASQDVPCITKGEQPLEPMTRDGIPKLAIFSNWTTPEERLCTEEEAREISLTPGEGCAWEVTWSEAELFWSVTPPEGILPQCDFKIRLNLEKLVTTAEQGTAYLYVKPMNIPGFPANACYFLAVDRRFPIRIRTFKAESQFVRKGDKTTVTWDAVNTVRCMLNGRNVKAADTESFIIDRRTEFFFEAQNLFGDVRQEKEIVEVTNWKKNGEQQESPFFVDGPDLLGGRRIFLWEDKLVAYRKGVIYSSHDRGGTWTTLWKTEDCKILECGEAVPLVWENTLHLLGEEKVYHCSLTTGGWSSQEECSLGLSNASCALSYRGEPLVLSVTDDNYFQIFCIHRNTGHWTLEKYTLLSKLSKTLTNIDAMDAVVCGDAVYFAVRQKDSGLISVIYTEEFNHYRIAASPYETMPGWFRLLECRGMLLLVSSGGICAPLDPLVEFPNQLPVFMEDKKHEPWAGSDGGGGLVVLTRGADKECSGDYWQFKL